MSGILRLESLTKGNTLKQGDKTPLKYRLFDADGEKLNIAGKSAQVRLVYPDFLTIGYEKDGLTVAQDDTVTFTIDSVIPPRMYHVEIIVDDQFIFPSRADESKFTVDKSSLGTETNIIEIVGVDAVVRKAVDLINADPSLIIDEDKLVNDIISNTGIGSIEEYYQQFNDVVTELSEEKDYHSLPEISAARGGHDTLGQRLDDTTAQLAHNTQIVNDAVSKVTVDSEVILARDGHVTLNARLNSEKDRLESGKADKVVLENLIKNGNFSDGTEGWSGLPNHATTGNKVVIDYDGSGRRYLYYTYQREVGNIVYSRLKMKVINNPNPNSTLLSHVTNGISNFVTLPDDGEEIIISGREMSTSTGRAVNQLTFILSSPFIGEFSEFISINLTETFGAGNEPTKEEMDELIEFTGYIDGEYALNNKEMLGHLMKGIRDNVNESVKDSLNEFPSVKSKSEEAITKAEQSTTKSEEALTKSQNALNVANGIDAKVTEALSKSTDADALSKSVQSQFNQVVIDGDSSVAASQARVDASGHTHTTLKERLDKEHNEVTAQLAQTNLKKANQIGIDVTNPPNGLTPAKADNVTDDTLAINNILLYAEAQGIKNVFIPEGTYRITDTINLFRELQLTLAHNAVIRFVSLTNNIFKMATRSVLTGGKVVTRYDFTGSVFYYRGVVSNSTVDGTKCYGTNFKGTDFRDINTGTIVHFDGYYPTEATEDVRLKGYCQYNTVKNVYAQWYGTFLKAEVNEDRPFETSPWFTANTFFNIELERVNRIVDMNVGGANFFDHLRVQCGPQDDLLFYIGGRTDLNRFTNIIYYDIVAQTQIVEMGKSSAHNYFELWYDGSEYRAKTINHGYRNRIEAPGAMLEIPKEIPLTAEWAKTTGAYPEPRVFKTKEGIVHIEGVVTNLTETTGEPFTGLIGVLPVGYRPRGTMVCTVASGTVTQTNVWINHSNGEIRAYSNVGQIHLSGIAPYRV